jgi:phosphate starvation-inducible membrane PsiE
MYSINHKVIIASFLQIILQVALVALVLVLSVMLTKEVYHLFIAISGSNQRKESVELIELTINFFLYFAFISLIIKILFGWQSLSSTVFHLYRHYCVLTIGNR